MTLFSDLYPTPKSVIRKMLSGISDIENRSILEPSAGKGDIMDSLVNAIQGAHGWGSQPKNLYCIESNPELRLVLSGKGHRVIGDDFLTYKKNHLFDLIVMNPPFSNGAAHLLKAWEILNGGDIVCLLNAETILNPHTKERQLLKDIIDKNGSYEILGDCFAAAERKTDVNVALVRLKKPEPEVVFDFFENKNTEKPVDFEAFSGDNLPAMRDTFGNMEILYDNAREACADLMKAKSKLAYYFKNLCAEDYKLDEIVEAESFNEMVDILKSRAWDYVFRRTKISQIATQKVRQDFDAFQKEQGNMDFTKENIRQLFEMIYLNRGEIMKQCILDAFDKLTKYDDQNRVHVEGWKTNDAWKVNQRVIVPWGGGIKWGGQPEIRYERDRDFADIEKALCFLTGDKPGEDYRSTLAQRLGKDDARFGEWLESKFFDFRVYKKGTVHLKFRDKWLWEKFNIAAAGYKNWLPDDYKRREKTAKENDRLCA